MPDTKDTPSSNATSIDFEQSLQQLEEIVRKMEQGELTLENALEAFEEGVRLTRNCQTALQNAEQKVKILMANADGDLSLADFGVNND